MPDSHVTGAHNYMDKVFQQLLVLLGVFVCENCFITSLYCIKFLAGGINRICISKYNCFQAFLVIVCTECNKKLTGNNVSVYKCIQVYTSVYKCTFAGLIGLSVTLFSDTFPGKMCYFNFDLHG